MIFKPKINTFANEKSMNCGFIAILANRLGTSEPKNGSTRCFSVYFGPVRVGFRHGLHWVVSGRAQTWLKSQGQFGSGFSKNSNLRVGSVRVLVIDNFLGQYGSGFLLLNTHPNFDTLMIFDLMVHFSHCFQVLHI